MLYSTLQLVFWLTLNQMRMLISSVGCLDDLPKSKYEGILLALSYFPVDHHLGLVLKYNDNTPDEYEPKHFRAVVPGELLI